MERIIKGFCLSCMKDQEIIVENNIGFNNEIKLIGYCKFCKEYICRVMYEES